jgi:maleylacetate reductase
MRRWPARVPGVLAEGLPRIVDDPDDIDGRDAAFYGGYLAAVAFASAGSGLHHKICHVLGGSFGLPHAQTHATVLPYVLAFNAPDAPDAERRLAGAFGSETAVAGLQRLRRRVNAPQRLSDLGFRHADVPRAIELILDAVPASNPRPVSAADLTVLLRAACDGEDPTVVAA